MLVRQRHWQKYETFVRQYETAADELADRENDPRLRGLSIAKRQFERWLSGTVKTEPYPDHCRVLEYLFGRPVRELLAAVSKELEPTRATTKREGNVPPGEGVRWSFGPADPARGMESRTQHGPPGPRMDALQRELNLAAHESSEHAGFVASHSLEPATLEQLHDDIAQIARQYGHTPPLLVYGDAKRVRNLGVQLLARTKRSEQEDDLYLMIGQACALLASVSFDLGNRDAATEQARSAWIYGARVSGFDRMNGELGTEHGRAAASVPVGCSSLEGPAGQAARGGRVLVAGLVDPSVLWVGSACSPAGGCRRGWPGGQCRRGGRRARSLSLVADRSSPRAARYEDLFTVPLGYRAVR